MGRSPPPPPGSATGKLATQYELNRWDDVYVPNAEVRVTACHPDTSLGVSATCQEANGGPSIVRSQGWYSNSKKDTSVTLSCDFWNNFWFWMICSRQKFLHKTASKKHLAVHTIWRKKSCLEHWKQSMKIPPVCGRCHQRPRGVSLVPKMPKVPSLLPFIPWIFNLGTFGTGLYSYWCWTWSCDQGSQSANPCCRKWGNRPFNSSGVFQCVTVPRGREIGGWIGGQIDQSVENDVAQQKKMILRDWMR